jgi:hypothetical protein
MNSVNSMYRTVTERFGNLGSERVHYKLVSEQLVHYKLVSEKLVHYKLVSEHGLSCQLSVGKPDSRWIRREMPEG